MDEAHLAQRIWAKVQQELGCWTWTGRVNHRGYGQMSFGDRECSVHRLMYRACVGPVPKGLCLDHLCRNRRCVNPAHLEPVTNRENILRGEGFAAKNLAKTHCLRGHEYTKDNVYFSGRGGRYCKVCAKARLKARRLGKKLASINA